MSDATEEREIVGILVIFAKILERLDYFKSRGFPPVRKFISKNRERAFFCLTFWSITLGKGIYTPVPSPRLENVPGKEG